MEVGRAGVFRDVIPLDSKPYCGEPQATFEAKRLFVQIFPDRSCARPLTRYL